MADFWDLQSSGAKGVTAGALGTSLQVQVVPSILLGLSGWCGESGTIYICVFDSATAVANGNPPLTWPKQIIQITTPSTTNGNFGLAQTVAGEYYANGIWVGVSTTAPPNFTLTTSSLTHFNALAPYVRAVGGNP